MNRNEKLYRSSFSCFIPFLAASANEQTKEPDTYTISIPAEQTSDTYIISIPAGEPGSTPGVYTVKEEAVVTEDDVLANDALRIICGEGGVETTATVDVYFVVE